MKALIVCTKLMNRTQMARKVVAAIVTPGTASIIWWVASIFTTTARPSHCKCSLSQSISWQRIERYRRLITAEHVQWGWLGFFFIAKTSTSEVANPFLLSGKNKIKDVLRPHKSLVCRRGQSIVSHQKLLSSISTHTQGSRCVAECKCLTNTTNWGLS